MVQTKEVVASVYSANLSLLIRFNNVNSKTPWQKKMAKYDSE